MNYSWEAKLILECRKQKIEAKYIMSEKAYQYGLEQLDGNNSTLNI